MHVIGRIVVFFLCVCTVRGVAISKADWGANADSLITAYDEKSNLRGWLGFVHRYNGELLKEAKAARRSDKWVQEMTFLMVVYFNYKLARQTLIDNRNQVSDFDDLDLAFRQCIESVRSDLLRLNLRSTDSLYARFYQEYRQSFGNRNELILRSP